MVFLKGYRKITFFTTLLVKFHVFGQCIIASRILFYFPFLNKTYEGGSQKQYLWDHYAACNRIKPSKLKINVIFRIIKAFIAFEADLNNLQ